MKIIYEDSVEKPICGWLNIKKEYNISSARVVSIVKKVTGAKKAGHAGTLDPLATGVLPVALGSATKTIKFMMNGVKTYEFVVRWGIETDTHDKEGKVIRKDIKRPTEEEIKLVLKKFRGYINQKPPNFSAVKVNGVRSYKLAREEKILNLPSRRVNIKKLELVEYTNSNYSKFFVECEKGVYIRSLARDLSRSLGTCGHVSKLCRLSVNSFYYKNAILLADLSKLVDKSVELNCFIPLSSVLDDIPALEVDREKARMLSNGQRVHILDKYLAKRKVIEEVYITCEKNPMAIGRYDNGYVFPKKVF
jgi:tRNA pseudouridine55 synthase